MTEMTPESIRELIRTYLEMRQRDLHESKVFYFQRLLPVLRPLIEDQPEHLRLRGQQFETLVSLMGFSPETTVISTLILQPKKLVVAFSNQARREFRMAVNYLVGEGILEYDNIQHCAIDAMDPGDVYANLERLIPREGSRVFDVTGGTKLMSATAGYLAWEHGLALCYLDGHWDPKWGAAGLEVPSKLRLYRNPSQQQGYAIRNHGVDLYVHGSFVAARRASRTEPEPH